MNTPLPLPAARRASIVSAHQANALCNLVNFDVAFLLISNDASPPLLNVELGLPNRGFDFLVRVPMNPH